MRKINFQKWIEQKGEKLVKKPIRRRPTFKWKLIDSIAYIKIRDRYLRNEKILIPIGKRRYRLFL